MKHPYLTVLSLVLSINFAHAISIDETRVIPVGDIKQFISIQGKNENNPILLYLHGGPGQAASPNKEKITSNLEKDFVIVHWDQRNTGKTLELNISPNPVTIELMQTDAEVVFQYLLKSFNRERIVVVAHSWGNVLGFHLAQRFPNQIATFFSVSPSIYPQKSQHLELKQLKKYFKKEKNEKALTQLSTIQIPHRNMEEMIIQYRWQSEYGGETVTDEMVQQYMPFFLDWEQKWMPIYNEMSARNLFKQLKEVSCPVIFFIGKEDYTSNFKLTATYYKKLKAPSKEVVWFETGHNIPMLMPELFQKKIMYSLE